MGAALDVDGILGQTESTADSCYCSERFLHCIPLHVFDRPLRALEREAYRRRRANSEHAGVDGNATNAGPHSG
jgi:hypothetical protein